MARVLSILLRIALLALLGFLGLLVFTNTVHVDFGVGHAVVLLVLGFLAYKVVRFQRTAR